MQASDGTEAYTRAGDLHVDPSGVLMTATGNPVLGDSGPITVPPQTLDHDRQRRHGVDRAAGPDAATISTVGRIKLVNPPAGQLDARRRRFVSHAPAAMRGERRRHRAAASPGALESSNVNIAETMANMIELARNYELQVKAMKAAEDNAASSSKLLQSS